MSIVDSGVRLRANDATYSLAGNADLTDKEVIVYNDGNIGLELVATDHVLALPAHVKVGGTEKAFRAYGTDNYSYGYWQGGNFGYLHQWNITGYNPLLFKYPFSGAGTDLDFPVVDNFCASKVGDWWLGVGGWFEIVGPTWTDPSWDEVSLPFTYFTDKTKCNGRVYLYRIGANYYVRIWTLTNGVWGYATKSNWYGLNGSSVFNVHFPLSMWQWGGDIFYDTGGFYCKDGVLIKDIGFGETEVGKQIIVGSAITYVLGGGGDTWSKVVSLTKFDYIERLQCADPLRQSFAMTGVSTDNCIVVKNTTSDRYTYLQSGAILKANYYFPESPFSEVTRPTFNGGEGGKALRVYGSSNERQIEGFSPVAETWTDYGRPWG